MSAMLKSKPFFTTGRPEHRTSWPVVFFGMAVSCYRG